MSSMKGKDNLFGRTTKLASWSEMTRLNGKYLKFYNVLQWIGYRNIELIPGRSVTLASPATAKSMLGSVRK